jgi:hypothetical protein
MAAEARIAAAWGAGVDLDGTFAVGGVGVKLAERAFDAVVAGGVHRCEDKGRRRHRSSLFFGSEMEGALWLVPQGGF